MSYRSLSVQALKASQCHFLKVSRCCSSSRDPFVPTFPSVPSQSRNATLTPGPGSHERVPTPNHRNNSEAQEIRHGSSTTACRKEAPDKTPSQEENPQAARLEQDPKDWTQRERYKVLNKIPRLRKIHQRVKKIRPRVRRKPPRLFPVAGTNDSPDKAIQLLYPEQPRPRRWSNCLLRLSKNIKRSRDGVEPLQRVYMAPSDGDSLLDLFMTWDVESILKIWISLSKRQKATLWPHLMLRCLACSTDQALAFLLATHVEPFPSFEIAMDAMNFLWRVRGAEIGADPRLQEQYQRVLLQQQELLPSLPHKLLRRHLVIFLKVYSAARGRELYQHIIDAGIDLNYQARALFLSYFIRCKDAESALKVFEEITAKTQPRSGRFLRQCKYLLKMDSIFDDGISPNFRILPRLLEAGINPDLEMHNRIITNAEKLGASAVAWDLFRYMQERNLPTDAWTYHTLLRDAYTRHDSAGLEEIMATIFDRKDLYETPWLMVYALFVLRNVGHEMNLAPSKVVSNMLEMYSRNFSMTPLKHLKLVDREICAESDSTLVQPDITTLAYVLRCYTLAQHSSIVVQSLFAWVECLRSQGDRLAHALASCRRYYDGFIMFYARTSSTFPRSLEIIQTMLDRNIEPADNSWRVLLSAFVRHDLPDAAQELKSMMGRRGIDVENLIVPPSDAPEALKSGRSKADDRLASEKPLTHQMKEKPIVEETYDEVADLKDAPTELSSAKLSKQSSRPNVEDRPDAVVPDPYSVDPMPAKDLSDKLKADH